MRFWCWLLGHDPKHKMRCMICARCGKVLSYHDGHKVTK